MGTVIVFFLIGLALFGFFGLLLLGGIGGQAQKAKENAPALLDAAFDGRGVVTWKVTMDSLDEQTVITGADKRGYRMTGSTQQGKVGATTLVFEKRD